MVASNAVTARLWLISHIGLSRIFKASVVAVATLLLSSQLALAQFSQQGPKLVGTGAAGYAYQGGSVALSADGNTAIVGGPEDNSDIGAAWSERYPVRSDSGVRPGRTLESRGSDSGVRQTLCRIHILIPCAHRCEVRRVRHGRRLSRGASDKFETSRGPAVGESRSRQ
jgi:hypothetical protein